MEKSKDVQLVLIILNYFNFNLTIKTVKDLIDKGIKHPIIVVDNLSPNESYTELKRAFIDNSLVNIVRSDKNGGYSYGNNFGVKYAESKYPFLKYVCIMNPDISLESSNILISLTKLLEQNNGVALATGVQIIDGKQKYGWDLPTYKDLLINNIPIVGKLRINKRDKEFLEYHLKGESDILNPDVISGCFFLIKLKVLKDINYFDENVFLYFEENILSHKLKEKNLKCAVSLKDVFYHNHEHKSKKIKTIRRDFTVFLDSQKYYCEKILNKKSTFVLWIIGQINKNVNLTLKQIVKIMRSSHI
jgi:GT2 family glycosyltransferase